MKNKRLASKLRQGTRGGSLPGSRSAGDERRTLAGIALGEDSLTDDCERASSQAREARSRDVSILLHRTILQLFPSNNGTEEVAAEGGSNGAWEPRPTGEKSEVPSFGPNARALNDRYTAAPVAGIRSRFPLWKRLLDLCLIFLTMCIWLPLMVLIMCLIKIVSPGPAFYRQERIGFRGRPFMIFKFRSMKVNAETRTHEEYVEKLMRSEAPLTKLDANDPRLTSFGRFLRMTGLDELPQLFNVLRGDMSLVGPRPCTSPEFASYLAWQKTRVAAPPGLTGYWQVNGKNKTTFNEMMEMDLHYAREMSLWLDLSIIWNTLPAIFEQTFECFARRSSKRKDEELIAVFPHRRYDGITKQI
jgi:lipopolysaccharide/colanic/teichoic acid biosynthesis glycosyltransferase